MPAKAKIKAEDNTKPEGAKYALEIELDEATGEVGTLYFKPINRHLLSTVLALAMPSKGNPEYIRAGEVLIENCAIKTEFLATVKADEELFISACFGAYDLINFKKTSIKKV